MSAIKIRNCSICSLIFFIGFLHAVSIVMGNLDRVLPFSVYFYGDSEIYLSYAEALSRNIPFDNGIPFHPPLPAYILMLTSKVLPIMRSVLVLKVLLCMLFGGLSLLVYLTSSKMMGPVAAISTGLLNAQSFALAVLTVTPGNESWYLVFLFSSLICLLVDQHHSLLPGFLAGFLTGCACLCRGEHIILGPLILLWSMFFKRSKDKDISDASNLKKQKLLYLCIALLGMMLPIAPWMLRNYSMMTQLNMGLAREVGAAEPLPVLIPVTLYGPLNFALANLPPADGEFSRRALPLIDGRSDLDVRNPDHRDFVLHGYRKGFAAWIDDPVRGLNLSAAKLNIAIQVFSNGFTAGNFPAGLNGIRRPIDLFSPYNLSFQYVLISIAIIGLIFMLRYNPGYAWLILIVICFRLTMIVAFFGYVRQAALILPFAIMLCTFPLDLIERAEIKQWVIRFVYAMALIGIVYSISTSFTMRKFNINYGTIEGTEEIDHHLRVELHPSER